MSLRNTRFRRGAPQEQQDKINPGAELLPGDEDSKDEEKEEEDSEEAERPRKIRGRHKWEVLHTGQK